MDANAAEIKNIMTLDLLVQILKERGILTDKELKERLSNTVKLSSMDADLKEKVIEEIEH
ncbi:hypothetical protein MKY88_15705 [Lysinibacillus sp. FSL R7-0073]|uniref:hypothetical protein n=1 Tax=Lysinibacillus TaxID=400634 RepID=UPI00215A8EB6|nr:hypothetical protein [Lysinibacillus fusiformis]MCR8853110.1 hypothetical protein [Lysinibacillus fusiformis]MED4885674.1 hypothetical protein [Lysinibacillus fusiformis]WKT75384.1 hypothetical protein QYY55_14905 [Lysinibacillus fusiformis]